MTTSLRMEVCRSRRTYSGKTRRDGFIPGCLLEDSRRSIARHAPGLEKGESGRRRGSRKSSALQIAPWILVVVCFFVAVDTRMAGVEGFPLGNTRQHSTRSASAGNRFSGSFEIELSMGDKGDSNDDNSPHQSFDDFGEDDVGSGGASMLDDLDWRVNKLRLEEANTRRFLKAGPRFLPYEECCKWVQAFGRWHSKEDW